jgi:tetrapyrrole methylase family protein/MazG family protein
VAAIPQSCRVIACDDIYEREDTFDAVYTAIARRIVRAAAEQPVLYAVPGDPAVGETTVVRIKQLAAQEGAPVRVVPGVSFIGPTLECVGWDALDGLQIADATAMAQQHVPSIDPDRPALIAQVYSPLVASDLKLVLLSQYPEHHPVTLVSGAGSESATRITMPLEELDRRDDYGDLATLAVPPRASASSILSLAELVARLRAPDGCPWDREQTHESLRPFLLEETYEALGALDTGDMGALCDELGDILLQIALHAQLAVEDGDFCLADVVASINDKIVRRHPHVFGSAQADTADDVRATWDELKRRERNDVGETDPFAGIPDALPSLARAQLVHRKAEGLDLAPGSDLVSFAALAGSPAAMPEDRARVIGDALWSVAVIAAGWGVDAETALRDAVNRVVAQAR